MDVKLNRTKYEHFRTNCGGAHCTRSTKNNKHKEDGR